MSAIKRKCNVVMLPTEKVSHIVLNRNTHLIYEKHRYDSRSNEFKPQHLYILSDEEIREEDWFIAERNTGKKILQAKEVKQDRNYIINNQGEYPYNINESKKIIATTDKSISLKQFKDNWDNIHNELFPELPPKFIQKFISEYNKGNQIKEVMVEYKRLDIFEKAMKVVDNLNIPLYSLKVDKNNYITITKCKDSWNRSEVTDLIQSFAQRYNLVQEGESFIKQNL